MKNAFMKHTSRRRLLPVCLVLMALAVLIGGLCGCSPSSLPASSAPASAPPASSAPPAPADPARAAALMDAETDPQRAIAIGRECLDQNLDSEDLPAMQLCDKLVGLYREQLADEAAALEFVTEYREKSGGSVKGRLENHYFDLVFGQEDFAALLPALEEYRLEGRPLSGWSAEELWAWLPESEGSSTTQREGFWVRSESLDGLLVKISWSAFEDGPCREQLDVSFSTGGGVPGPGAPLPALPRGVAFGDDMPTVLEKLGFGQSFIEEYAPKGGLNLFMGGEKTRLHVTEYHTGEGDGHLVINYEGSSRGAASFFFKGGALTDVEMASQR